MTHTNTYKKLVLFLSTALMLTACGGGSGNPAPTGLDRITEYAQNGGTLPILQDYLDAGVTGINSDEALAEINQVLEGLVAEDVDTTQEVQALVDTLAPTPYEYSSYEVLPTTTDPDITNGLSMQFAYITKEPNLRKNKLFIFLPGTGASPRAYKKIIQTAAEHGYYSFGLHYDNSSSSIGICKHTNDENCVQNALKEYFEGVDYSSEVEVSFPNSFINRITKMILYLNAQNPSENWNQFLTANNEIKWNLISLAGHSMGSRHVFFISKQVSLYKVGLFSGPNGFVLANGDFPAWLSNVGATDNANITGFANLNDNLAQWNYVQNIWQIIGLQGTPLSVDNNNEPNSHQLFTDYVPQNNSGSLISAHNSTCVDIDTPIASNGRPKFENVWKYMCFPD